MPGRSEWVTPQIPPALYTPLMVRIQSLRFDVSRQLGFSETLTDKRHPISFMITINT